jgi:ribosomal protein S18 acetylase RimI-like enzyme
MSLICLGDGRSAILRGMSASSVQIAPCPTPLVDDALAIVLRDLSPEDRQAIGADVNGDLAATKTLIVALRDTTLVDAAWGQPQAGNCAVLWPPRDADDLGCGLIKRVAGALDQGGVRMSQAMVVDRTMPMVATLEAAGFEYLADLLYLSCDTSIVRPLPVEALEWVAFDDAQFERLARLTEATYAGTHDCPALNGRRPLAEVLAGYRATGVFRPQNWQIARLDGRDVGVLMLADHGRGNFLELVYMGIVPAARGRGFGREIVLHALKLARVAGTPRVLVAVDAANGPALKVYRDTGFNSWDRRAAYVRFRAE